MIQGTNDTFIYFSTLYTTIPHDKSKSRLTAIVYQAFCFKNGEQLYEYIVVNFNSTYFVKIEYMYKCMHYKDTIILMRNTNTQYTTLLECSTFLLIIFL